MTTFRWNVIANFIGNSWLVLLTLVSIPLIVGLLGIESYGVIGFAATLFSILSLLDFGLGAALSKVAAQTGESPEQRINLRNLVRSLEFIYWLMGLALGLVVYISAPFLVDHWLNASAISYSHLVESIRLIGVMVALRWPIPLYLSGLMGLEKQVLVNKLKVIFETLRIAGSICAVWLVDASLSTFFLSQIVVLIVFLPFTAAVLWRHLPESEYRPRFHLLQLFEIRNFATGMAGISITTAVLMQLDKVLLSGLLSLKDYGYYALASSAAMTLFHFASPVSAAVFPKLARLVKDHVNDSRALLIETFHRASQLVSFLVFPAAFMAIFFSHELLYLWTNSPEIAKHSAPLLSILVVGNLLNSMMLVPYALQLSYGWVGLALKVNIVSVMLLPAFIFFGSLYFGGKGAAAGWVVLNLGYFLIAIPLMHKKLIPREKWRWYLSDIAPAFASTLLIVVLAKYASSYARTELQLVSLLTTTYLLMVLSAALCSPVIRNNILYRRTINGLV